MQAIVISEFGPPEVLKLQEVADLTPGPDQIVVEVKAAGVNPVDTYQRAGGQGYQGSLPFTPGIDGAGIVSAVGQEISGLKAGDRVYLSGSLSGTYAEQCLCSQDQVHPLPTSDSKGNAIGFEHGASLWVNYGTAYRALFQRGEAKPGDWVLVHGATGGVGIACVQWAQARDLQLIGTAGSEEGEALLKAEGVRHVLSHHDEGRGEAIREITGGGPTVIVENLANANLEFDMGIIGTHGRIVIVGSRGSIEVTPRQIMGKEADVRGLILYGSSPSEREEIHSSTGDALASGALRPVIQRTLPLREAAEAHRSVIEDRSHGKIVLVP